MRNAALVAALLVSGCATQVEGEDSPGLEQLDALTFNALTFNALTFNALSANARANPIMPDVPLDSDSYNGGIEDLKNQLSDPTGRTQEFFHYLVTCALEPGQTVDYKDELFGGLYSASYEGELGLCPSWHTGKASDACRQVVSSCLLSRQNAFGVSVQLSMRGHDGDTNVLKTEPDELKDFDWREGAFFGDVFGSLAQGIDVHVDDSGELKGDNFIVGESMYTRMYACYSDVWTLPDAYMQDRICAGGGTNCVATSVGDCYGHPTYTPNVWRCKTDDDEPEKDDGDYQYCEDNLGSAWENALTVWLDKPCDIVTSPDHCGVGGADGYSDQK
jgi:hypothetical protein